MGGEGLGAGRGRGGREGGGQGKGAREREGRKGEGDGRGSRGPPKGWFTHPHLRNPEKYPVPTQAVFVGGWGVEPPAKISDPPAAIKKRKGGGRLSMFLCISTVVDFNSQNFDPPNEI